MALTINTNIMSLNAQRNLSTSQTKLSSAIARLSSGNRINSAKDDAAGLAISTRFTTQINGLNRAVQNANDGISLSQTTESALDEVTNNLQRIRELAVQSTNASNSPSDREALDAEVQQRLSEVTRIATQTNFNGMKVLDGSAKQLSFQVGANVGEVITVGLDKGMKANQVGQLASVSATPTGLGGVKVAAGDITIKVGTATAVNVAAGTYTSAADLAKAINDKAGAGFASVDATSGELKFSNASTTDAIVIGGAGATALGFAQTVAVGTAGTPTAGTDSTKVADAYKPVTLAAGDMSISVGGGKSFDITGTFKSTQDVADAINAHTGEGVSAYVATDGSLKMTSSQSLTVTAGATSPAVTKLGFTAGTTGVSASTLADSSIKSVDGANETINRVDAALQSISSLRSDLGAVQNRFESTISNLQNISQNLTSSKSAITDADFAQETANMSSAQILQQAGVSVLAQANQSQQIVQKLLQ
ncbi:flagellin [Luteibacter sp. UNCMF331Sha3.1]|uniref:flagellin N-terminal helical domain-containing protein n=1 Tax=Luteibacter sp. UNCMF331Sha3.1 TaxID=1502760 RepID=UPI0008BF3292|nr:flagellin [Luteibacter sp. UNCMF331Sha3.1]SEM27833.1 flagellin [Luteibacter sp. UNCMF331Sha3.1]